MNKLLFLLFSLMLGFDASAGCTCTCMNGQPVALCSSTLDIKPICAPAICPVPPPAVRPIDPPKLPPIGAQNCQQEQVLNPATKQYEWRRVCH